MDAELLAKAFKALSNEQRLRIFCLLCEWQETGSAQIEDACQGVEKSFTRCCGEIGLSRSTISHHFKELQASGLIGIKRTGQSCLCTVNPEAIALLRQFIGSLPSDSNEAADA